MPVGCMVRGSPGWRPAYLGRAAARACSTTIAASYGVATIDSIQYAKIASAVRSLIKACITASRR